MSELKKPALIVAAVVALFLVASYLSESGKVFTSLSVTAAIGHAIIVILFVFLIICAVRYYEMKAAAKSEPLEQIILVLQTMRSSDAPFHGQYDAVLSYTRQQFAYYAANGGERIKYTSLNGRYYSTAERSPIPFAFICVALYATDARLPDLREYCDNSLFEAETMLRHF